MYFSIWIYSSPMDHLHLVGLYTTRLLVFRWKAKGYDWILVDSIGQITLMGWRRRRGEGGEERRQWSTDGRSFWYEISHANKATNSRKSYCLEGCLVQALISLLAEEDVLVKKKWSSLQAWTYIVGHVVHQASLTRGSVAWSTYYRKISPIPLEWM